MRRKVLGTLTAASLVLAVVPAALAADSSKPVRATFGPASALRGGTGAFGAPYGYLPLHPEAYAGAKARANARDGAASNSTTVAAATVATPANVSPSWNGIYQTGVTPPDANGAVGPNSYLETINTKFAIYTRSGSLIKSGSLASLTGITNHSLSDPNVKYDVRTGRFYYSAVYFDSLSLSDNGLAVGFSKTANPKSAKDFCKYRVSYGGALPDYPKLGDSGDFVLVGYNEFSSRGKTYDGSEVFWLGKPPSGAGCPAASTFKYGFSGFLHNADTNKTLTATPVPADLVDDSNGAGYVVGNADLTAAPYTGGAGFLTVFKVTTDATGNAVFSAPVSVSVGTYGMPPNAPEAGSSSLLDTLDGRLESAVAAIDPNHNGSIALWTAHAVASSGGLRAEERWYEIDPNTGAVLQSGAASDPSLFVWNGAISSDRNGTGAGAFGADMVMGVNTSSSSTYPAIRFVSKKGTDAQSPLTPLVQSAGPDQDFSCSPCRWGDYSGASPDPSSTGTVGKVWLSNQYNVSSATTSGTDWRTWNFAVAPA